MNIVLASTSPRRQQLLALANVDFVTQSVEIDETVLEGELPQDYIVRMVSDKAQVACDDLAHSGSLSRDTSRGIDADSKNKNKNKTETETETKSGLTIVITSDTIGVLGDGKSILVKPKDKADAFNMWSKMSGTTHTIWTAVQLTVIDEQSQVVVQENLLEKTDVSFVPLSEQAMEAYWQTGEPQDKAGSYAIQGRGAAWVHRIEGSYTNVVGLPLAQTLAAIERLHQQHSDV